MLSSIAEELDLFVENDCLQYSNSVKARTVVYACRRPGKRYTVLLLAQAVYRRYSSQLGVLCVLEN